MVLGENKIVAKQAFRALSVFAAAIASSASFAAVDSGTLTGGTALTNGGVFEILSPAPAVVSNNQYQDNNVRAFNEVQDMVLVENFIMDQQADFLTSNVLGPGSVISSHFVLFDPASSTNVTGTISFNEAVVGVIQTNTRFDASDDVVGNPGTNYAIGNQGLENLDTVTIVGNTVEFELTSNSPGDTFRVITSANPQPGINVCVPEEVTLSGVITGGSAQAFRQICAPIGPVGNDNFDSLDVFAFEEQQSVELLSPLAINSTESIAAGEFVSSFYVIWDPVPFNRAIATITFPDTIIAVIGDRDELLASEFLGNFSASYLNPTELGLEAGDNFVINGNELNIDFVAGTPGDSIRVILGSASSSLNYTICEPEDETLSGEVTGGEAFVEGGTFSQLCGDVGFVGNDNFQANDLFVFEEAQNVVLTTPLELDEPPMTQVPVNSEISSYYVAFDPSVDRDIQGSISFPGDILGVATSISELNDSDYLGNPTANYLNPAFRGLESDDSLSFSGNVLSVNFTASSPGDYVRVIVGVPQVDTDGDGVVDNLDNCIELANPDQLDTNADGYGNRCDPDLDNNGFVNFLDVSLFVDVFGTAGVQDADLNGDTFVNFLDFAIIPTYFGLPPGPSGLVGSQP